MAPDLTPADASVWRNADGVYELHWNGPSNVTLISRELMVQIVATYNKVATLESAEKRGRRAGLMAALRVVDTGGRAAAQIRALLESEA